MSFTMAWYTSLGKKKQEHNPNAPPLNRQIQFPVM